MKKLQIVLHYLVFILMVAVIIFSGLFLYNKLNKKGESQYIVNRSNTFHDEVVKIPDDMAEEEKPEVTQVELEVKETTEVAKAKPEVKKITKITKPKPKPKPIAKKMYDGKALYVKNCKLCHGNLRIYTKKINKNRVDKLFAQNAKELSLLHEQSNVSKITNKYFKTKEYKLQIESIGKCILNIKSF